MLLALDNWIVGITVSSGKAPECRNKVGSEWHNNASSNRSEFTSACLCYAIRSRKNQFTINLTRLEDIYMSYVNNFTLFTICHHQSPKKYQYLFIILLK